MRKWLLLALLVIAIVGVALGGGGRGGIGGLIFLGALAAAVLVVNRNWRENVKDRFTRSKPSDG